MFETNAPGDDEEALAAAWVVRLSRGPIDEADYLAFIDWLDRVPPEDPELRRRAFDRAQRLWLEASRLRELDPPPRRSRRDTRRTWRCRLVWAAAAATAAALVLVAAPAVRMTNRPGSPTQRPAEAQVYVTAAGEHRTVNLADGSHVQLDGATRLVVTAIDGTHRDVTLATGEAAFDVKHDPRRPFRVGLGSAEVQVLGTAFDAVRSGGRITVGVTRGLVGFSTSQRQVRLPAGESATLAAGVVKVSKVNPTDVSAWREGRRLYWDEPLSVVVSDLNRGYAEPIRLGDVAAGRLRFTGVLVLGPEPVVARRLAALLPLHARPLANGSVVLSTGDQTD